MKRFIGLLVTLVGAAAAGWGGVHIVNGEAEAVLEFSKGIGLSALVLGLAGVACLSLGLVWMRD
jgi:hypothetical protein